MATDKIDGGLLLRAVEAVAISPAKARAVAKRELALMLKFDPEANPRKLEELAARRIISRYTWLATGSGAATALPSVLPGFGLPLAIGTALGDATIVMKLQVDMCLCLAEVFGYDVSDPLVRRLAFLVAAGATYQKAGGRLASDIASKAGVTLVRQYMQTVGFGVLKQFFDRIGQNIVRRTLERAIPFGLGLALAAGGNHATTRYVGAKALTWFMLDRELRDRTKEGT